MIEVITPISALCRKIGQFLTGANIMMFVLHFPARKSPRVCAR